MAGKLTLKQELFVAEYLVDLNATQAAIRAGYSKKSARKIGEENRTKPDIAKAIQAAIDKRAAKSERTAADVLKDIQGVTQEARKAGDVRSALKGLELEGKHLGMFTDKVNLSGSVETVVVIRKDLGQGVGNG